MNRKLVIVLAAVMVLLFVAALGVSVKRPTVSDASLGWVRSLGGKSKPPTLAPKEVTSSDGACLDLLTKHLLQMDPSQTCDLDIATASAPVRSLPLEVITGTVTIKLNSPPPKPDVTLRGLGPQSQELQVFDKGGTLTVECVGTQPCRISVGKPK